MRYLLLSSKRSWITLFCLSFLFSAVQAQDDCSNTSELDEGYTTSISGVTDNGDGSYTIVLTVINDGCSGCRKLNAFTVQAAPGTYSDVSVEVLSGPFSYANIDLGPNLSGTSLTGFRINNTNGMGNGNASAFTITYTLTGPLQDQQTIGKAGPASLTSSFTADDFQNVLYCQTGVIFPYFDPYANKSYDIIGVELTSLYYIYLNTGTYISDDIFQILGNSVRVTVTTRPGQHANAVALLTTPAYGLVQEFNDPINSLIEGTFPVANLLSLNLLPELLVSVRPIYAALSNAGLITSQGDTAMRSYRAREVFGVDGTGVKVGVLSDSYNTILGNPAGDDVERGDLPGPANPDHPTPVDVLQDYPFGSRSDEGRAMMQIVHDVAPGAELAFRTGFLGAVDFANGIRALEQAGCDVIVDDISYISEPFFRDGVVAQAVDQVKALGVSYFSAAGNFGTKSWQGTFAPAAAPAGVIGEAHNFAAASGGGTDILQNITLYEGEYTVVFQWDDGTPGNMTSSDFDIYLATSSGSTLFGFNSMNIGGAAFEVLPFVVAADSVQSNIVIVRESGSGPALLKYVVYRGQLKINEYDALNASTVAGQANAAGAIAVGAVLYENTPEYLGVPPTVASFSSRGGTPVNGVLRQKPDICAPNGVNTSVDLGGFDYDGDAFPNFFGTSAAAPHAAGVAALLIDARNKYYGDVLSPDGVKGILQNTAIDMHDPGYDILSGAGYILADSALMDLANPTPYIHSISYDTTLTPGVDTLLLTVYGEYLSDASTVWLDGVQLTEGVVIEGDTAIITIVNPFAALYPEIQVFNPPMAGTNGLDGGLSNPLYFTTKETILVSVNDATKKYGEELPAFTAQYTLESVSGSTPLDAAGLEPYELDRIHAIDLTTVASALSNVGLWGIGADPSDPLSPNSNVAATDTLDISLLQRYNILFDGGLLTIDPMEMTITPRDTTFIYNDSIVGISYDYTFNGDPVDAVPMNPSDSLAIVSAVKSAHGTALVNATGLVRGTALVNSDGEQLLTDSILNNFSFMISQAVKTTRGTALVNGELIDPEELLIASALTNSAARMVRGTALVNAYKLVRGTALVNTIDTLGNITNTSPLVNSESLVNSSGILNSSTITLESNSQTLVILGESDIAILSGDSVGEVEIRSVTLITGNTVGTHRSVSGTYLTNNFIMSYGLGNITILPDTAEFFFDAESLVQTYDGSPLAVSVSTVPDSLEFIVTYDGDTLPPVNAGVYQVEVSLVDTNYFVLGSSSTTLEILPANALITIDPASLDVTYNGSAQGAVVSTEPSGLDVTVTYDGESTLPVNAGTYLVSVTVNDPNYIGSLDTTLVIQQGTAAFTIDPVTLSPTYSGAPMAVGVSVEPAGVAYTVTYDGGSDLPVNAGSYAVHIAVDDPNYVGFIDATLVIQQATAVFTLAPGTLTQMYSGAPTSVSVSVDPAGVPFTTTYNGGSVLPVNAGSYAIHIEVNDPNYTGSEDHTLVIAKVPATATTGIYVINKNDPLPSFTASYSGFINGEDASVVSSLSFVLSPNYNGNAGIYSITVNATATNYAFTSENGTLYVNPSGPGTKQVKPVFLCTWQLEVPDANGFTHIAYFTYENKNQAPVYVPIGPNNAITGPPHDPSEQPELFLAGGGAVAVPMMNTGQLTWQVSSNNNNGSTGSIPANQSNVMCSSPGVKVFEAMEPETNMDLRVYPNPSTGQVFLEFAEGPAEGTTVEVYNALGMKCAVPLRRTTDRLMELDLVSFGTGLYVIMVLREGDLVSRTVIIE